MDTFNNQNIFCDFCEQDEYVKKVQDLLCERSKIKGQALKACVVTFGCQQNEADSERLMGTAKLLGYEPTEVLEDADLIIYNTCAVREHAELKALSKTGQLKHIKEKNPNLLIGLWGCMVASENRVEDIKKKYPYVNFVAGTNALHRLPEILHGVMSSGKRVFFADKSTYPVAENIPVCRKSKTKGWLSIMYGCNNFCTYCIVPYARGRERSRKPSDIINEAKSLIASGCKEITLLGQNVNSYGKTLAETERITFAKLLSQIASLEGDFVVRFMTSHPKDVSDELIEVIRDNPKIERHFHLPLQSGNSEILAQMNRKYTRDSYLKTVQKLKEQIPDIALTTDIIVGFPNETEEQFEDTLSILEQVQYDAVFSFIYSPRPGTPASEIDDKITYEQKTDRHAKLLTLQRGIVVGINKSFVGKTLRVLCENVCGDNTYVGRTSAYKLVKFVSDREICDGDFVDVKITDFSESMLIGQI